MASAAVAPGEWVVSSYLVDRHRPYLDGRRYYDTQPALLWKNPIGALERSHVMVIILNVDVAGFLQLLMTFSLSPSVRMILRSLWVAGYGLGPRAYWYDVSLKILKILKISALHNDNGYNYFPLIQFDLFLLLQLSNYELWD